MANEEDDKAEPPSKTLRKKEAHALQKLGEELTGYGADQLQQLPLTDKLTTQLLEFKRLPKSHGARKRQLQFIGKLMRDCDYEAITLAISKLQTVSKSDGQQRQLAVDWSEKILNGSDSGNQEINELLSLRPQLDRQKLRQLYRDYSRATDSTQEQVKLKLQHYLQQFLNS